MARPFSLPQVDNEATCRVCAHNPDMVVRRPRFGLAKHVMAKSGLEVYDLECAAAAALPGVTPQPAGSVDPAGAPLFGGTAP